MAALRNRTFFSLYELNQAISELLPKLNNKPFQKLEGTRRSLYEELDKPALKPLPPKRYEYAEWRHAKVNIDYHVEVDRNYYSVPYQLVGEIVDIRLTDGLVEALHRGKRVASHPRATRRADITQIQHMPASHRKHREWTPSRLIGWAESVGPQTTTLVTTIWSRSHIPSRVTGRAWGSCGLVRSTAWTGLRPHRHVPSSRGVQLQQHEVHPRQQPGSSPASRPAR